MNTEATLNFGEVEMRKGRWAGVLIAGIAVLGMAEFGYAQLRQVRGWPLSLIASSAGRLITARLDICSGTFWLAPLGLIAAAMLTAVATVWKGRRTAGRERVNGHE
jgi:hypothetical protein